MIGLAEYYPQLAQRPHRQYPALPQLKLLAPLRRGGDSQSHIATSTILVKSSFKLLTKIPRHHQLRYQHQ